MRFIGKYGEHVVLARLLAHDIECYPALKHNQDSYDITAIVASGRVVRVQVKATNLQSASTNNAIGELNRQYDFLVIVVVDQPNPVRLFVLNLQEAIQLRGTSKQLAVSRSKSRVFSVRTELLPFEEQWSKISTA